jgi:hypothetical protein
MLVDVKRKHQKTYVTRNEEMAGETVRAKMIYRLGALIRKILASGLFPNLKMQPAPR